MGQIYVTISEYFYGKSFCCLFVLGLGLDVSHGAALSFLSLTIITVFGEFPEVISSLCAIKEQFWSVVCNHFANS